MKFSIEILREMTGQNTQMVVLALKLYRKWFKHGII